MTASSGEADRWSSGTRAARSSSLASSPPSFLQVDMQPARSRPPTPVFAATRLVRNVTPTTTLADACRPLTNQNKQRKILLKKEGEKGKGRETEREKPPTHGNKSGYCVKVPRPLNNNTATGLVYPLQDVSSYGTVWRLGPDPALVCELGENAQHTIAN